MEDVKECTVLYDICMGDVGKNVSNLFIIHKKKGCKVKLTNGRTYPNNPRPPHPVRGMSVSVIIVPLAVLSEFVFEPEARRILSSSARYEGYMSSVQSKVLMVEEDAYVFVLSDKWGERC